MIVYAVVLLFALILVYYYTFAFFMGKEVYDVLFTTDSGAIYAQDCFLNFTSTENDLRQPYFALLGLPFGMVATVVSWILPWLSHPYAIGIEFAQGMAILFMGYLLADIVGAHGREKYVVLAGFVLCFSQLFFLLLVEQYVVGTFYLLCTVFLLKHRSRLATPVCALSAGGMLTSLALAPWCVFQGEKGRSAPTALLDALKQCLCGIGFILLFFAVSGQIVQLDPAYISERIQLYTGFSENVDFFDRLCQYTNFTANLFLPSHSEWSFSGYFHYSLIAPASLRIEGVVLLLLAVAAFVLCRKERAAWLCGYWILFSLLLFLVVGYGTAENGLILYSHYFAWSFLGLYYMAIRKLCYLGGEKRGKLLFFIFGGVAAAILLALGIWALWDIFAFSHHYYGGPLL